jgi:branched-chain amino acid transport system permease protein
MLTQVLLNSLAAAGGYVLVAIGFGLIYSTCRFFHFAHGVVYTVGAYGAYAVSARVGGNWWLALVCALVVAGALGGAVEILVYRPMRRAGASSTVLFLASLGLLIGLQNLIALTFGDGPLVLRRESANTVYTFLGASITRAQLERLLVAAVVSTLVWGILRYTRWGREARATANDSDLARNLGVHTDRVLLSTFILGSILAGLAAVMLAHDTDLRPSMGFHVLLVAVVAMVVGGIGSVPGTALGALLVAILQNMTIWLFPAQWGHAAAYLLMIIFLLVRPRGFLGGAIGPRSI